MRWFHAIAGLLLVAAGARAAGISGVILPPGKVRRIRAFEREGAELFKIKNRYHEGTIDPKTGRFEIPNLPDGTYQLLLDCGDATIEGVDLAIDDEENGPVFDYVFKTKKLTVRRLDLSEFFDPDEAVSEERKQKVAAKVMGLPKLLRKLDSLKRVGRFCDHVRPLLAHGTRKRAFVLVEKARLRDFHAGRGQAIYRVEVWGFRRIGSVWDKPTRSTRVLRRHRFRHAGALRRFGVFFEPQLGGIRILDGRSVAGIRYTVPAGWDDAMGKVPGRDVRPDPPAKEKGEE